MDSTNKQKVCKLRNFLKWKGVIRKEEYNFLSALKM